ncbi:MAG: thermonuclease family protein [Microscillaceae bacterium]|nr:thermonuclease family protein [Microscillaceae bacterium]MDW8459746.1 thermonuclease family protein [Cytophagales bacterium]
MNEIVDFIIQTFVQLFSGIHQVIKFIYQAIVNKPVLIIPSLIIVIILIWFSRKFVKVLWLYLVALNPYYGRITRVVRCADGDTIIVGNPKNNRRRMKVRLIGVDTPESERSMYLDVMPFGKEAAEYTKKRLTKGKRVILIYDKKRKDDFGRVLAYLYLGNGEFFNATLIRLGYAFSERHPPNLRYADYFDKLQAQAQAERRGLWKIYKNKKELTDHYRQTQEWKRFKQQNYGNRPK